MTLYDLTTFAISALSLLLSGVALWKARAIRRQNEVIERRLEEWDRAGRETT